MSEGRKAADPRVVARNIIREHGRPAFRVLIQMFQNNESGAKIGHAFQVSRQRVHQWKKSLGYEQTTYVVHQEIAHLATPKPRSTSRTQV